jgi:hypothetical protein
MNYINRKEKIMSSGPTSRVKEKIIRRPERYDDEDFYHKSEIEGPLRPGWVDLIREPLMEKARENIELNLRREYPNGDPSFIPMAIDEIALHSRKNHDFAHGGNPLGNFERVAALLSLYPGLDPSSPAVVAITYMLKQLDAALWLLSQGHRAIVEGMDDRWRDVGVYSKIIRKLLKEATDEETSIEPSKD